MLPRPTAGGARRLKPVCTHGKAIFDFCSWRGMLALSGCRSNVNPDAHDVGAAGGQGVWLGDIDDLWKMGKPRGVGGPWKQTAVVAGEPSDPYLMYGYDHKIVELNHDALAPVTMTLEVDVLADGTWHTFSTVPVPAGQMVKYEFPAGYSAHWIRVRSDTACHATARFIYE